MTIVLQSFRSYDVPDWIQRCMASVRAWAQQMGFAYEFAGDEFLAMPPQWFREKAGHYLNIVTDLARLLWAKQRLSQGADRVIWIDADLLIFQPACLQIDPAISYAYGKEAWCRKDSGQISTSLKINNSACMFRNDGPGLEHLNGYIADCLSILKQTAKIRDHTLIGTRYLTERNSQSPLPVLRGFGLLSPLVMRAFLTANDEVLQHFRERHGEPIYGANLCNFLRAAGKNGMADGFYSDVVEELTRSRGRLLNESA